MLLFNRQMRNGPFAGIAIEGHPVDRVPGEALIDLDLDHKLFTGIKITLPWLRTSMNCPWPSGWALR